MKTYLLVFVVAIFSQASFAQNPPQSSAASEQTGAVATMKIGDSFAKAALLALKAIESDDSKLSIKDGGIFVNRHVSDLIDAADVEQTVIQEKVVLFLLHSVLITRETNNIDRAVIGLHEETKAYESGSPRDTLAISERVANDPAFIKMNNLEHKCFTAFEENLRARSASIPSPCTSMNSDASSKATASVPSLAK